MEKDEPRAGLSAAGGAASERNIYNKPTHIAQTEEPWSRLSGAATLASTRLSVMHHEHQAPRDSLDFQLKSVYDNHKDFFRTKAQMLLQKESLSDRQWKKEMLENDHVISECGSILRGAQFTS